MAPAAPLVVVGSGVAGLCTALAAAPRPVLLLGRGHQGVGSASELAQGGVAAAMGPGDRIGDHVADTLVAGAGHNHRRRVELLAAAAPAAIDWLLAQGVAFDREGAGGGLRLGREGGHGRARIVHGGGDASGARMVEALVAAVAAAPHVQWRGGVDVDGLLLRGGRVVGVHLHGAGAAGGEWVQASAVVLATGGIGALFARTTNPAGADGAGIALAMAAGAQVRDLEFVQFHPTALDVAGPTLPLVTEALRGAGARLLAADGQPVMDGLHPQGDLAPRDVVARAVLGAARQGSVWLDARGLAIDWPQDFPTVLASCLAHGIDPRHDPVPVTPAAHFHMGGIATDALGRSSVPGLHAVGEVACTGVHGANRLASNSLLEAVVFGRRLGAHLARGGGAVPAGPEREVCLGPRLAALELAQLRLGMWRAAGPVRDARGLQDVLEKARAWSGRGWQARLGVAILAAALGRRHSLGAHWRSDAAGATDAPAARDAVRAVAGVF